ncbi:MAG: hypothetical protein AAGC60_30370 [Acidobacteriota bacterium]
MGSPTPSPAFAPSTSSALSSTSTSRWSYFRCTHPGGAHRWKSAESIDNPQAVECPAPMLFGASCKKPLQSIPSLVFGDRDDQYSVLSPEVARSGAPRVEHTFLSAPTPTSSSFAPRRFEQRSQDTLTEFLVAARGIELLCRDGTFRESPRAPTTSDWTGDQHVDEPGFTRAGVLRIRSGATLLALGRLEVSRILQDSGGYDRIIRDCTPNPLTRGTVTYPDFVLRQGQALFAVELKTPNASTLAPYLARDFFDESTARGLYGVSRTVVQEIEQRAGLLPESYQQIIAFDLHNLTESPDQSIAALQSSIRRGEHSTFWRLISGFLFVDRAGTISTFSMGQVLEHQSAQTTLDRTMTGVAPTLQLGGTISTDTTVTTSATSTAPGPTASSSVPPPAHSPSTVFSMPLPQRPRAQIGTHTPVCESCSRPVGDSAIPFCSRCMTKYRAHPH